MTAVFIANNASLYDLADIRTHTNTQEGIQVKYKDCSLI